MLHNCPQSVLINFKWLQVFISLLGRILILLIIRKTTDCFITPTNYPSVLKLRYRRKMLHISEWNTKTLIRIPNNLSKRKLPLCQLTFISTAPPPGKKRTDTTLSSQEFRGHVCVRLPSTWKDPNLPVRSSLLWCKFIFFWIPASIHSKNGTLKGNCLKFTGQLPPSSHLLTLKKAFWVVTIKTPPCPGLSLPPSLYPRYSLQASSSMSTIPRFTPSQPSPNLSWIANHLLDISTYKSIRYF